MKLIYLFLLFFFTCIGNSAFSSEEVLELGKQIFKEKGNCATCHTFIDAQSNGNIGPNLNEIRPDLERVIVAVTNGMGVMPAYQDELTQSEIEAVATYVSEKAD